MKTLAIAFIISQIVFITQIVINIQQTLKLTEFQKEISCLRHDLVYAGGEWCAERIEI